MRIKKKEKAKPNKDTLHKCINCGLRFYGTYCNNCGQKYDIGRLTFTSVFENFLYGITNLDRGIFYTLFNLFSRPGLMIKDYIAGHRVIYAKPFSMLIILSGIYGILFSMMNFFLDIAPPATRIMDGIELNETIIRITTTLIEWTKNNAFFWALIMLPFYALSIKIVLKKNGARDYNYTEALFIGAYIACQRMIIDIILFPYRWYMKNDLSNYYTLAMFLLHLFLWAWCFVGLFNLSWKKASIKSVLMYLLSIAFPITLMIIITVFILLALILFSVIPEAING